MKHEELEKIILSFKVKTIDESSKKYIKYVGNCSVDFKNKIIYILNDKDYLWVCCDVEDFVNGLNIEGKCLDAYGTILTKDDLILNNHDINTEDCFPYYLDVIGFATINKQGVVKYSQIVYSLKYKRLLIRDKVKYKLPFKVNIEKDFGGKRATYRMGSKLSLRTNLSIYKKVSSKYKQSDKFKNDLSYPRLILNN